MLRILCFLRVPLNILCNGSQCELYINSCCKNLTLTEADSKEEADKDSDEEYEKQEKQDTQEKQAMQENRVLDDNKNETQIKNDAKECEANGSIPAPTLDPGYGAPQCPRNKSAPVLAQCNMLSMGKWISFIFQ